MSVLSDAWTALRTALKVSDDLQRHTDQIKAMAGTIADQSREVRELREALHAADKQIALMDQKVNMLERLLTGGTTANTHSSIVPALPAPRAAIESNRK